MKFLKLSITALLLSLMCAHVSWASNASSIQSIDGIVAVVNDSIITQSELNSAMRDQRLQLQSMGQPVPATLRKDALNQLIDQTLQLQLAQRNHLQVSDQELNKAISDIAKRNNLDKVSFIAQLEKSGVSYSHYKTILRKQIIIAKLQGQAVGSMIKVTQADVSAFLKSHQKRLKKEYHVLDVVIPNQASLKETQTMAQSVLKKLKEGSGIKDVQTTWPSLVVHDLGWRTLNDLPDIFQSKVPQMSKNQWSQSIQAANGLHLLQMMGIRKQASSMNQAQAKQQVFQKKYAEQIEKWLSTLRSSAYIKIK